MYYYTNPILEDIQAADYILIKAYRKIATALKKKGDISGYKKYVKKMFDEIKHRKQIQKEIELNEREAGIEPSSIST
jgi:hypothetical protein